MDDLVIFSDNIEDHIAHISKVLSVLMKAGVILNAKKCQFEQNSIKFLGFIVGDGKSMPDPEKIECIRNFPRPCDKKQMRSFLGLVNFYRKFLPNLRDHLSLLSDTLRKISPNKIKWDKVLSHCYEEALQLISADVELYIPRKDCEFVIQTDSSSFGIGAVLGQTVEGDFKPISFISRKLNKAETNYSVIEQECLAIKWAIEYYSNYLYGARFRIRTDHAPLTWLRQNKDRNCRLTRWALALQPYDFVIEYIKGNDNFLADMLSRAPIQEKK